MAWVGDSIASLPTPQLAHLEFPHPVFSRVCAPTIAKHRHIPEGQVPSSPYSMDRLLIFSPSPRQAMSRARKTPPRRHPWTPLRTSALCPPGKRWRQRSRQLSTKVLPVPSSPRGKATGQRGAQRGAHSQQKRASAPPVLGLSPLPQVGLSLLGEAGSHLSALLLSRRPTGSSVSLQLALCLL